MVQESGDALSEARVLLIAPQPFYSDRGTPMNVSQLCRALTRAGLRVDLATYPIGEDIELPGLRILRAPRIPGIASVPIGFSWKKLVLDVSLALLVASLVLRNRYRLVHAVEEAAFIALPLTWLGTPVIYDLDSLISDQLAYSGVVRSQRVLAFARALERLALRRSRAAITVCRALSESVHQLSPTTQVFQIEDVPLEEALRDPDPQRMDLLRARFGLQGRRVILYTGNLESYQGIPLLVEAMALLKDELPDALCVLVGGDAAGVHALRRDVEKRGLENHVRVVGKRPRDEMCDWMALAEILASPRCDGENTPLKVYTYMASGVPIVASDLVTHTQVLDRDTAILCEASPGGLARAFATALRDPAEARARAQRARALLEREYSFEAFERKLRAAYTFALPDLRE